VPGDGSRYIRDAIGVDTVIVAGGIAWSAAEGYTDDARGSTLPAPIETPLERIAA